MSLAKVFFVLCLFRRNYKDLFIYIIYIIYYIIYRNIFEYRSLSAVDQLRNLIEFSERLYRYRKGKFKIRIFYEH
jgi:hypothetical protein